MTCSCVNYKDTQFKLFVQQIKGDNNRIFLAIPVRPKIVAKLIAVVIKYLRMVSMSPLSWTVSPSRLVQAISKSRSWSSSIVTVAVVSAQDFGYGGQHGPEHWGDDYQRCSGKFQSPINIDVLNVTKKEFPYPEYFNFDAKPKSVKLTNNGHTVLVTMDFEPGKVPRIRGGPLERKTDYQFEQFHFHWGENDTVGSEDLINNQAYPAELHVVMRSLDYKDFQSALDKDHGIAVLAFFFKVAHLLNQTDWRLILLLDYSNG